MVFCSLFYGRWTDFINRNGDFDGNYYMELPRNLTVCYRITINVQTIIELYGARLRKLLNCQRDPESILHFSHGGYDSQNQLINSHISWSIATISHSKFFFKYQSQNLAARPPKEKHAARFTKTKSQAAQRCHPTRKEATESSNQPYPI